MQLRGVAPSHRLGQHPIKRDVLGAIVRCGSIGDVARRQAVLGIPEVEHTTEAIVQAVEQERTHEGFAHR